MLSKALEKYDLIQMSSNPNVGKAGNKDCLLFCINDKGIPSSLIFYQKKKQSDKNNQPDLWKHSKGNHHSFPVMNPKKPILNKSQSKKISEIDWKASAVQEKVRLLNTLDFQDINPYATELMLSEWSLQTLEPVMLSDQSELQGFKQLLLSFPKNEDQALMFNKYILKLLQETILYCSNEKELDLLKDLLVGKWDAEKHKYTCDSQISFDVSNNHLSSTTSLNVKQALINLLNEKKPVANLENGVLSPLSGKLVEGIGNKYPNPNVPRLGNMYLFSRNKDIPCLTRYGANGSGSFQIGDEEAKNLSTALEYLTDPNHMNMTWQSLHYYEKTNLLLCYLPDDPANEAKLAELLSGTFSYQDDDEDDSEEDDSEEDDNIEVDVSKENTKEIRKRREAFYLNICKAVLSDIETALGVDPNIVIMFEILERLDKGRCQIALESTVSYQRFKDNLNAWIDGVNNQPKISWKMHSNNKLVSYRIQYPGPNEIHYVLRQYFDGTKELRKQGILTMRMIYQLYMPENQHAYEDSYFLNESLDLLLRYSFKFLANFSHNIRLGLSKADKKNIQNMYLASKLISLYSVILYRLKIGKEKYMKDVAYNVGQLLQLADVLHKEYSVQVRNGGNKKASLPPQLMGNELLSIACEHPIEGINRLRERMRIYLAWANTVPSETSHLSKWILKRLGEVTENIATGELPNRFSPAEQAQVLLGYLATVTEEKKESEVK